MRALAPYTPGPWQGNAYYVTALSADGETVYVAEIIDDEEQNDGDRFVTDANERDANGRLLGAAPDLAQALKALLSEVREMQGRVGWAGNGAREAALAALTKAGLT